MQKRIIGWALVAIGVTMLLGAVVNNWPRRWTERDWRIYRESGLAYPQESYGVLFKRLLVSPFFYLGLFAGVGGVVVLKGDSKSPGVR